MSVDPTSISDPSITTRDRRSSSPSLTPGQVAGSLLRDPFVRIALLLMAAAAALFALPIDIDTRAFLFDDGYGIASIALTMLAFQFGKRVAGAGTRRFAEYVTIGLGCWLVIRIIYLAWPEFYGTPVSDLVVDLLYLGFYLLLALASLTRAHRELPWRGPDLPRRVETCALMIFLFFALAYFVLVPGQFHYAAYDTWVPSLYMYIALDLCLALRYAYLTRVTTSQRHRWTYGIIALACLIWAAVDLVETLGYLGLLETTPGSAIELLWLPVHPVLIAAARVRHVPFFAAALAPSTLPLRHFTRPLRAIGPVVVLAFLPPLLHFAGYLTGLFDPSTRVPREVLVLITILASAGALLLYLTTLTAANRALLTDLQEANAQLQQSHKMEAIGRLAGGVAHDFNNLLTAIIGYDEALLERLAPADPARRHAERIRTAAGRATALTRQLLTFARPQTLRVETCDLSVVVAELVPMLRPLIGEDIELLLEHASTPVLVRADRAQLEQVIVNLVVNARDAMPEGGRLTIGTAAGQLTAESGPDGPDAESTPCATLTVTDTGTGMDSAAQERIFEPFYTTKEKSKGTGLGLSTVYGIVQRAEGIIRVDSRVGEGTTMRVMLPRVEAADAIAEARVAPDPPSPVEPEWIDGATILVVEDEDAVRGLIRDVLETDGYRVLEARDGVLALGVYETHGDQIDLLLTDVVMPQMNGPELAEHLVGEREDLQVLFVSGYHDESDFGVHRPLERAEFLPKPFTPTDSAGEGPRDAHTTADVTGEGAAAAVDGRSSSRSSPDIAAIVFSSVRVIRSRSAFESSVNVGRKSIGSPKVIFT